MNLRSSYLCPLMRKLWLVVFVAAFCPCLIAQMGTANITGMVEDATGARVVGAKIELLNVRTGTQNNSISNHYGIFTLSAVLPGAYVLQIQKSGFATSQFTGITLSPGDSKQFLIHMKVGPVTETVTVNASSSEINIGGAAVGTQISGQFASRLPLNGGGVQDLISATPGVVPLSPQAVSLDHATQGEFSVNGQSPDANNYAVDGITADINAGFPTGFPQAATAGTIAASTALGTTQGITPLDELQSFKVLGSSYSAQYGRIPGGQFVFVTKSGTDAYHGSAFESFRNGIFNANDWFNRHYHLSQTPSHQNNFGVTLSGPLHIPFWRHRANKTYFLTGYEAFRVLQAFAAQMQYVPSRSLRAESPGLQSLLNGFPTPTGPEITDAAGTPSGLAPFIGNDSLPGALDSISGRLDQSLFSRLFLFLRYNTTPSYEDFRQLSSFTHDTINSRALTLGIDWTPSLRIGNSFRFGFARDRTQRRTSIDSYEGAVPVDIGPASGVRGATDSIGNYSQATITPWDQFYIRIPGVGATSLVQNDADNTLFQWNGTDIFQIQTKHDSLKFGIDARLLHSPIDTLGIFFNPSFYRRSAIVNNLASMVTGETELANQINMHTWSAFVQSDWRIRPSFTVSTGVRADLNSSPLTNPGSSVKTVTGDIATPSGLKAVSDGGSLWQSSWANLAPRLGIAWALTRNPGTETILRTGAGVFYASNEQVGLSTIGGGIGTSFSGSLANISLPVSTAEFYYLTYPQSEFQFQPVPPYTSAPGYLIPPHLQLPYTLQWNFSIEQALGRARAFTASYVGSAGRRLLQKQSANVNAENPEFGYIDYYPGHLTSSYNALQLKFRQILRHGMEALFSYTWAHSIDYGSTSPLYPLTRASSNQDIRSNFQGAFTWNLNGIARRARASHLLHGWTLAGRVVARSGFPITLLGNMHSQDFSGKRYYSGVDLIPNRPLYLYGPQYPGGRALNGGPGASNPAFAFPQGNSAGNAPRNIVRGFGAFQVNLAVNREFPIHKQLRGQFRFSAFNVFNHPSFGYIDPNLGDAQFGKSIRMLNEQDGPISPVYQQGAPRTLQFSLRVHF